MNSGDQTERLFSERLLPFVKANAYTWVRLQSEKRKHRKDHSDRLSGEDERSLRSQIDDEPVDEKRRWATRLLVKLRKDIIAQDREHFVCSIVGEDAVYRCVRTNPDQKQKMRRIDCFRQADKVWRLDLVTTVLFRGFPLESTDGERLGRTCANPLCIQPHHITIQVRELDLLLANFLVEAPPNLAINGAYTAEELLQLYSVPLSSLQGFHRPIPPSPSIPISAMRFPRKRATNDFGDMDEEMSDADSTVLSNSVTSEHDMSSPKIPALMNVPHHRMQQLIKTEAVGSSALSTSFPPRWNSDCLLRGSAQPPPYIQSSSALSSSMTSPPPTQMYPSFGQSTNYSSSLPTSMQRHNPHQFTPDFSQLSLNTIQAGSPPAAGIISASWTSSKHGRQFSSPLSTLSEPRGYIPRAGRHPNTVSPEGLGQRSGSPPPVGLLSEEDAEELISGGADEDMVPPAVGGLRVVARSTRRRRSSCLLFQRDGSVTEIATDVMWSQINNGPVFISSEHVITTPTPLVPLASQTFFSNEGIIATPTPLVPLGNGTTFFASEHIMTSPSAPIIPSGDIPPISNECSVTTAANPVQPIDNFPVFSNECANSSSTPMKELDTDTADFSKEPTDRIPSPIMQIDSRSVVFREQSVSRVKTPIIQIGNGPIFFSEQSVSDIAVLNSSSGWCVTPHFLNTPAIIPYEATAAAAGEKSSKTYLTAKSQQGQNSNGLAVQCPMSPLTPLTLLDGPTIAFLEQAML